MRMQKFPTADNLSSITSHKDTQLARRQGIPHRQSLAKKGNIENQDQLYLVLDNSSETPSKTAQQRIQQMERLGRYLIPYTAASPFVFFLPTSTMTSVNAALIAV